MAEIFKKDMLRLWAETGDIVPPTDEKISTGWAVEVVPRQWLNWMQNRVDTNVAYMLQKGIPEWDGTTEYIAGKSYVQHNNVIYKSIQTGTNQNPATATTYWQKALVESSASMEAIKTVVPSADTIAYFTGATTAASTRLTSFARTLLDDADAATARGTLGAQQVNTALTAISGVTPAADTIAYFNGTTTAASTSLSSFGRTLIDDLTAAAARTTLGLGSIATQNSNSVAITGGSVTGITDLAIADGGTGASDAAGARTNLGLSNSATIAATNLNTANTIVQRDASGNFSAGTITANLSGNATTATTAATVNALATARTISLAGDVTGSVSFDGSADVSITATVADDSHNHTIANVNGLQGALDGKAASSHNHDAGNITSGVFSIDRIPSAVRNLNQGATNQDPNLATNPVILTNHANSPSASYYWHITTTFYSTISSTSNRGQTAVQYSNGAQVYARSYYGGTWTAWQRLDNAGIPTASTSAAGVVQLSTSTSSTSTTLAATASAVKDAYDRSAPDTSSNNTSGWVKFGNTGVIIQWGVANASDPGTTVTFPVAFPAACSAVTVTYAQTGDKISAGAHTLSTTSFKLYGWAYACYWIAVGY
jgi:hypothetical protein